MRPSRPATPAPPPPRPHRRRPGLLAVAAVAVVAVVAAGCSDDDGVPGAAGTSGSTGTSGSGTGTTGDGGTGDPVDLGGVVLASALQTFEGCDAFLESVQDEALERVGPYGLDPYGRGWPIAFGGDVMAEDDAGAAPATTAADGAAAETGVAGTDYSTTNVQEAGVDEPDVVKTDGELVVALAQGSLQVVDVTGDAPAVVGTLRLDDSQTYAHDLLLDGDRVLVASSGGVSSPSGAWSEVTTLILVDVSDPTDPTVVERLQVDGAWVSARMVDGVVRIVLRSMPVGLEWSFPEGAGLLAEREATARNRAVIEASTLENWVPYVVREDGDGDVLAEGSLLDCSSVHQPAEFAGFGMLDVVTLDLRDPATGLDPTDAVGVLTGAETVYASTTALYVATTTWVDPERYDPDEPTTTDIHRFDTSDPAAVHYDATGTVEGWVLNQFALSEHDGRLRVATTAADPWGLSASSESWVTVLEPRDGELVEVGRVGDLGRGERIYSVRFVGDVGYVVTFRQTDPLYVIDLSDPAAPAEVGELELLGYSAYLHPLGDGLLLGVGQDANEDGRVQGTQVSLFDVSDPTAPTRVQQFVVPDGWSDAEWDHRAFLWWAATDLAVLPLSVYSWDEQTGVEDWFAGAVALTVTPDGITELGRISHGPQVPDGQDDQIVEPWNVTPIRRALVVGDLLYTLSDAGLAAHDLTTLAEHAVVEF